MQVDEALRDLHRANIGFIITTSCQRGNVTNLIRSWMYHTPNYCRLREYTNVVAACRHSIVQNAHALLDVLGDSAL